jgi:hypothetical protein
MISRKIIPTGRGSGVVPVVRHEPTIAPIKRRLQVFELLIQLLSSKS